MTTGEKQSNRKLDFNGFPGYWEIRKSTKDTDGEYFETVMNIKKSGKLPPHKHPVAEESYEVLSGKMEVYESGKWSTLSAGEKHTVPPGTVHAFRINNPVEVINVHKPALRYEEYFRRFHKLNTEMGVEMPPKGIKAMILLSMLQMEYEREFFSVNPPQWLFKLLNKMGRALQFKLPDQ